MFALLQAAAEPGPSGLQFIGAGIGIALTVIGAGIGIGMIGASMASGMARQPEASANIQTASIILAALIEGATLFALGLAFLKF